MIFCPNEDMSGEAKRSPLDLLAHPHPVDFILEKLTKSQKSLTNERGYGRVSVSTPIIMRIRDHSRAFCANFCDFVNFFH